MSRSSAKSPARPAAVAAATPWWDRPSFALTLAVFGVALVAYWPALGAGYIWDDSGHVTRPELRSLGGLVRIWTEFGATQQYYPLLHSAFWLESHLWGDAAAGYHVLNVLLHATGACLVARVLRRLSLPGAWIAALLFALHPVGVESVAWISEQKNTLSLVFYLCALLAYLDFDAERRARQYGIATLWFVAALTTKTVTASLPAALLVLFWWRRGRLSLARDVAPLLPWFVLSAAFGVLTSWVERTWIGAQGSDFNLGLLERVLLAGRVVWFYFLKLICPVGLSFVYPRWTIDSAAAWSYLFPLAAVGVALALLLWRRRGLLAGYLFFAGSLFPALGFVNVYPFRFSFVADHFQYLPSLGILVPVACGATLALRRWPAAASVIGGAVLLMLGVLTFRQSTLYHDGVTLFGATVERNPTSWMAQNNFAEALAHAGRHEEAIPHLETALKLKPDLAQAENNLGDDLRVLGRVPEAIPHLERAIQLQPNFAEAHNNLAAALMVSDQTEQGLAHFRQAIQLNPRYAQAHCNLGLALAQSGRPQDAIDHFAAAVRLEPTFAEAELDWGIALTLTNRFNEAVPHFERAIELQPGNAAAFNDYGRALVSAGRLAEGVAKYRQAIELEPGNGAAHYNLALALRQLGQTAEAAQELETAQRLQGGR